MDAVVLGVVMMGKEQVHCIDGKPGLELNVLKMGIAKLMLCWSGGESGEMARSRSDHLFLGRPCYDCSFLFPLFTGIFFISREGTFLHSNVRDCGGPLPVRAG